MNKSKQKSSMINYSQTDELAQYLFQRYFVEYLQSKNINPLMGSGPDVLAQLKSGLQASALQGNIPFAYSHDNAQIYTDTQKRNLFMLPANLKLLADTMVSQLGTDPTVHQFRLHETSFGGALRSLCPIFPFC
jgi:hypothetical protein